MIVRAEKLTPEQKAVFETLLGRPIGDEEVFLIDSYERPGRIVSSPTEEEREKAWVQLEAYLDERAAKRPSDLTKEEEDEIILEAMRSTRPNYTPID
jgi:cytochrome P450